MAQSLDMAGTGPANLSRACGRGDVEAEGDVEAGGGRHDMEALRERPSMSLEVLAPLLCLLSCTRLSEGLLYKAVQEAPGGRGSWR